MTQRLASPSVGRLTDQLTRAIRLAWTSSTSICDHWDAANPARGQCAPTALVVQDILGGKLLRGEVDGQSHYWNLLPDGTEVDLTREQFVRFVLRNVEQRTRDYVLSYPDTVRRYRILSRCVKKHLAT
jgi:hypothetical protein